MICLFSLLMNSVDQLKNNVVTVLGHDLELNIFIKGHATEERVELNCWYSIERTHESASIPSDVLCCNYIPDVINFETGMLFQAIFLLERTLGTIIYSLYTLTRLWSNIDSSNLFGLENICGDRPLLFIE